VEGGRQVEQTVDRVVQRADYVVERHLTRGLEARDIEAAFANMAAVDGEVDREKIRKEALSRKGQIVNRLAPLLDSWKRADSSLQQARETVERVFPKANLTRLGRITVALVIALLAGAIAGWVAFDFRWSAQMAEATILAALPFIGRLSSRAHLRRELSWTDVKRAAAAAERRFEVAAANQATVAIREALNEELVSFSTEFRIFDQTGLRSLADPEREVPTTATKELSTLMVSLSSGSIGLSGPRGSGKTTLVDSFARGRSVPFERERIGLVVSAPVKYDAKEFVLHLFAALCEAVTGSSRLDTLHSSGADFHRKSNRLRLGRSLEVAAFVTALIGGAMLVFHRTTPEGSTETGLFLLSLAGIMFLVAVFLVLGRDLSLRDLKAEVRSYFTGDDPPPATKTPEQKARDCLEQIRFQQSISSGWSGSIKLPFGLNLGGDSDLTMARAPWSLPEAVDAFRKYAATLTKDHYLVIGIDELDKMGSDDSAREFLNNVKGVFGVSGCYYLVSISDDAMASFERRGLPVRDVFDSSFDAVQRVGYLSLRESRDLLDARVIGLPVPYQCLCYCMSAGLPRDLVRITRELVHQAARNNARSMTILTNAVVESELKAKLAGAVELSRGLTGDRGELVQIWIDEQWRSEAPARNLEHSNSLLCQWAGLRDAEARSDKAGELAFEVAAFNYYAATVLDLFNDEMDLDLLRGRPQSMTLAASAIDLLEWLARARQQFAVSPEVSWRSVKAVRELAGLPPWEDPRLFANPLPWTQSPQVP
jgi:hypothetical protein